MSNPIPDKITWPTQQRIIVKPAQTVTTPASTRSVTALDFTGVEWRDQPGASQLWAWSRNFGLIQIMGTGTATPYNPAWLEDDARRALLAQTGLTLPTPAS